MFEEITGGRGKGNNISEKVLIGAIPVIIKLLLSVTGTLRDVTGMLWHTWLLKTKLKVYTQAKEATADYAKEIAAHKERQNQLSEGERKPHDLGPPHLHAFQGVVEGLQSELEKNR